MSNLVYRVKLNSQSFKKSKAMKENDCPPRCNKDYCDECPFRVKTVMTTKIKPESYGKDF